MLRQKWGSVVCPSCGNLVGVNDKQCFTCGRWNPALWGFAPALSRLGRDLGFTQFVIGACVTLYVLMLVTDPNGMNVGASLSFLSPSQRSLFLFGDSGVVPVFGAGRWWTVLTAGWLHAGLLHILFNMMWIRQLAPGTSELYGPGRMVIIYTIGGIVGFTASTLVGAFAPFLGGAMFTVGASAPIFGLLGALVHYGKRGSSMVGSQAKSWAVTMFIFGFIVPGIDNWAHLGGFVGGYAASKFLDPLQPERLDHLIVALGCLAATGIAIVFSIADGLRWIRS
jgi:rhomboid protease GluP